MMPFGIQVIFHKRIFIAQNMRINNRYQRKNVHQRILNGRCRQQKLFLTVKSLINPVSRFGLAFIKITELMRFVQNDQIPIMLFHTIFQLHRTIIRTNRHAFKQQRIFLFRLQSLAINPSLNNPGRQIKFLLHFSLPLLAKTCRRNNQNGSSPARKIFGNNYACLNRLSQTDFIGQNNTLRQRGFQGKQRRFDLMRIHINFRCFQ